MARKRAAKPSRVSAPILWMGLCVILATVVVQTTRSGIDILALLIAAFILLVMERTLGDWVAESVGPAPTALIFALVAGMCVAYVTTDGGRGRAERLLVAAESRGYRAAYFRRPTGNEKPLPDVRPTLPGPRGSVADSTPGPAPLPEVRADAGSAQPAPVAATEPSAAKGVRLTRLTVSPEVSVTGQAVTIRATMSYDEAGTLPQVVFSVDGRVVGSTAPDARGIAQVPWRTSVPGQYVVRARFAGGLAGGSDVSATLNVLPGR